MPLQISTLKFWINLEPLDYFQLIGTARGGRSRVRNTIRGGFALLISRDRAQSVAPMQSGGYHFCATACTRLLTFRRWKICCRWFLTVKGLMPMMAPISWLVLPWRTHFMISICRAVNTWAS